ncbi:MAG: SRPBCC family protein [Aeromicrobium erythreum]
MPQLRLETMIDAPPDVCFGLAISVDAHTASMGASGERAVAGVTSGEMRLGDTVTWRARHFGLPFRLTSRITVSERPDRFVDEQVRGPFGHWRHEHRFELRGTGTLMVDRIDFASPLGPLGRLVDAVALERYMRRLIETRNAWLAEQLATGSGPGSGD